MRAFLVPKKTRRSFAPGGFPYESHEKLTNYGGAFLSNPSWCFRQFGRHTRTSGQTPLSRDHGPKDAVKTLSAEPCAYHHLRFPQCRFSSRPALLHFDVVARPGIDPACPRRTPDISFWTRSTVPGQIRHLPTPGIPQINIIIYPDIPSAEQVFLYKGRLSVTAGPGFPAQHFCRAF